MSPPRLLHTNRLSAIDAMTNRTATRIAARGGDWVTMRPRSSWAHRRRSEHRLEDLARDARLVDRRARHEREAAPDRAVRVGRRDHRVRVVREPGQPEEVAVGVR